ncbi:hypothetical protein Stsp01_06380 [Streptomyces sp. NBRC 13847]|nr:hypothetical protein Stsp01_06380 [Streptomyces sp. NBRC 13847]
MGRGWGSAGVVRMRCSQPLVDGRYEATILIAAIGERLWPARIKRVQIKPGVMEVLSLHGSVEENLRQLAGLGKHRPMAGVHLDQPPALAVQ